jgi:hypothetical protein
MERLGRMALRVRMGLMAQMARTVFRALKDCLAPPAKMVRQGGTEHPVAMGPTGKMGLTASQASEASAARRAKPDMQANKVGPAWMAYRATEARKDSKVFKVFKASPGGTVPKAYKVYADQQAQTVSVSTRTRE